MKKIIFGVQKWSCQKCVHRFKQHANFKKSQYYKCDIFNPFQQNTLRYHQHFYLQSNLKGILIFFVSNIIQ
jgi:hypothetical protein